MAGFFKKLDKTIENWLLIPETNAAGNYGIFRILFAIVVFIFIINMRFTDLTTISNDFWRPIGIMKLFQTIPPLWLIQTFHLLELISLVLVMFGYRTRLATLCFLISIMFLEGFRFSFGKIDHATHILYFFIPAIMVFYDWGKTYSIDALRRKKRGLPVPDVHDGTWKHAYPIKFILLIVAILYFSAGYSKLISVVWITQTDTLYNWIISTLGVEKSVQPESITVFLLENPWLLVILQFATLVFELGWLLAPINKRLRALFIMASIVFHFSTYIILRISFAPMIFTLGFFLDWQGLLERFHITTLLSKIKLPSLPYEIYIVPVIGIVLFSVYTDNTPRLIPLFTNTAFTVAFCLILLTLLDFMKETFGKQTKKELPV